MSSVYIEPTREPRARAKTFKVPTCCLHEEVSYGPVESDGKVRVVCLAEGCDWESVCVPEPR